MLDRAFVRQEVNVNVMLIVRYVLLILGLSIMAVIIVNLFFKGDESGKQTAIYVTSFVLGFGAFELWWRKRASR